MKNMKNMESFLNWFESWKEEILKEWVEDKIEENNNYSNFYRNWEQNYKEYCEQADVLQCEGEKPFHRLLLEKIRENID